MWILRFKIYREVTNTILSIERANIENESMTSTTLVQASDAEYLGQPDAFKWIDEQGDKTQRYVILPVIRFDENEVL